MKRISAAFVVGLLCAFIAGGFMNAMEVKAQTTRGKILFDFSHRDSRLEEEDVMQGVDHSSTLLEARGFKVEKNLKKMVFTLDALKAYKAVYIFWPVLLQGSELADLKKYLSEGGGIFLVMDTGFSLDAASKFTSEFGIEYHDGDVWDMTDNVFHDPDEDYLSPIIHTFKKHDITTGVKKVVYGFAGGGLKVSGNAKVLATGDKDSWCDTQKNGKPDPGEPTGEIPVMAAAEVDKGRLFVTTDDAWSKETWQYDHARLFLNAFFWIMGEDPGQLSPITPLKKGVGKSILQKDYGASNLSDAMDDSWELLGKQYNIDYLNFGPVTGEILSNYSVFVLNQSSEKYSGAEITALDAFVQNGGMLVIIGGFGVDRTDKVQDYSTTANLLSIKYGVAFDLASMVFDDTQNYKNEFFPLYTSAGVSPILSNVSEVVVLLPARLMIKNKEKATALLASSTNAYLEPIKNGMIEDTKKDKDAIMGPFVGATISKAGKGVVYVLSSPLIMSIGDVRAKYSNPTFVQNFMNYGIFVSETTSNIEEARKKIEEGKNTGISPTLLTETEQLLAEAQKSIDEGNFPVGAEISRKALVKIRLDVLEFEVGEMKSKGARTEEVESIVGEGKRLFGATQYGDALIKIREAEQKLSQLQISSTTEGSTESLKTEAEAAISEAERMIGEAGSTITGEEPLELKNARAKLDDAKSAAAKGDYENATKLAMEAQEFARQVKPQKSGISMFYIIGALILVSLLLRKE